MHPFKTIVGLAAIAVASCGSAHAADSGAPPKNAALVYVGTYTEGTKSKGIYYYWLRTQGNEVSQNITLVPLGLAAESANPSFLEVDLKRRLIFVAIELDHFEGKPTGAVSAFSVE